MRKMTTVMSTYNAIKQRNPTKSILLTTSLQVVYSFFLFCSVSSSVSILPTFLFPVLFLSVYRNRQVEFLPTSGKNRSPGLPVQYTADTAVRKLWRLWWRRGRFAGKDRCREQRHSLSWPEGDFQLWWKTQQARGTRWQNTPSSPHCPRELQTQVRSENRETLLAE